MYRFIGFIGAAALLTLAAAPAFAGGGVVVPTPEPASMALLAAGIGGVAWAKFRGRK